MKKTAAALNRLKFKKREGKSTGYLMCVCTVLVFVRTILFYDKGTERF